MLKDIGNRNDVILLVNTFYDRIKNNPILGHIFVDIIKVDWEKHLPKMYSFWSSILLGEGSYEGNPMEKHIALSKIVPMTEIEFSEWLMIFNQTVDSLFDGQKATEAKTRAENIARVMMHKILP